MQGEGKYHSGCSQARVRLWPPESRLPHHTELRASCVAELSVLRTVASIPEEADVYPGVSELVLPPPLAGFLSGLERAFRSRALRGNPPHASGTKPSMGTRTGSGGKGKR